MLKFFEYLKKKYKKKDEKKYLIFSDKLTPEFLFDEFKWVKFHKILLLTQNLESGEYFLLSIFRHS